ncbi:MAG TPA: hypothetical protein VKU39_13250 [Streptosporangiaceae bacterium]|nr:hypothetical protein [Streptosporangiaceae bacterium]
MASTADAFDAHRTELSQALADVYAAQATGDRAAVAAAAERARAAAEGFATFTDPREHVGLLADSAPFALFPVRLETRFMTGGDQGPRLLVRVYPDDCSIDTFEALLSATELANAKRYWRNYWTAAGAEAGQRGAWRDLVAAHGSGRAGYVVATYQPVNLGKAPGAADPPDPDPVFPPDPQVKQGSWTQAPQVRQFPERFIVIGYVAGQPVVQQIGGLVTLPLYTGPDPSADPAQGIHVDASGDLFVPDQLRWMTDYDAAVAAGLGITVALTPSQAQTGFDRLLVLGVQMAATGHDGAAALEELLHHHLTGRSGLTLIPQGTPVHNTTGKGTGYTTVDDADQSFEDRKNAPLYTPAPDVWSRRDGQWLAEALGVSDALVATVHASGGQDQMLARAMQRALWPATLGYWMDKMMAPVFGDDTIEATRQYVTRYVSGRGALPAIRIGGQAYGVLPTTAYSRIGWLPRDIPFFTHFSDLLAKAGKDWTAMAGGASHVGAGGDPQQTLLDIVGLHPSSVEYYSRTAESISELFNVQNLFGFGPQFFAGLRALALETGAEGLLAALGYQGAPPDILSHLFLDQATQLSTIIDDRPLSETSPIRSYTGDGRNYIRWLIDAAKTSLDTVVAEQGFTGDASPQALLYLLLRHALMLGYYDTAYGLNKSAATLSPAALAALKAEPPFVHVAEAPVSPAGPVSESRFALLYTPQQAITHSPDTLVADYITAGIGALAEAVALADQLAGLEVLADAPTAQLERAFAEHVDLCGYRYDAWLLGLVAYQLELMRGEQRDKRGGGTYLGWYAWLENLRPAGGRDPASGGYIHAPSLPHARTAAILRSGYLANATPASPGALSVNLSSDRVRAALATLEGIRNGQSLGALLGYRFERGLHDDHGLAEVDQFIYPMRKAFPLVADMLSSTATPPGVPIEAIEARNVLDGRKLAEHIKTTGNTGYPFGVGTLPAADAQQAAAITAEAGGLLDVYDAIADLALAEGVHQAAQGNFDRIAATLDAYTTGNFPPDPDVAQTPPSGIGLTHRVAVHLRPGLAAPPNATPAARAEPAVDDWLGTILPPLDSVGCVVAWEDPVTHAAQQFPVTLGDLGVRPIDVLDLVLPDDVQAMTKLDDLVLGYVDDHAGPRPDAVVTIKCLSPPPGGQSIFEISALVRAVRTLVTGARPLRATDAALSINATDAANADVSADRARVAGPYADLVTLGTDLGTLAGTLAPLAADPVTHRATILAQVDTYIDQAVVLLRRAASFRLAAAGHGFVLTARHQAFAALIAQVAALIDRWNGKLAEFDAAVAAYDALPAATPDAERFSLLATAELVLTTTLQPRPATPALLRNALVGVRATFAGRRDQFVLVRDTASTSFSATLAALAALLPVSDVDSVAFDIAPLGDRAVRIVQDLSSTLASQHVAVLGRAAATQQQLAAHDTAATPAAAVAALQAAARAMLGEDFRIVPEFGLAQPQADEWASAVAASANSLGYLTGTAGIADPVSEWMHGVARVRPMVRAWERAGLLVDALRGPDQVPALLPAQFPYQAGAAWVAMQFPPDQRPDSDRLCYTAHYAAPFDKNARQCGLMLDEWTEVIPATTRTTGITFNFTRPDNEPPQAILLVTPASGTGTWQWDDLVGAVSETLDLAKLRAVEPGDVDQTAYSVLVPATITAATRYAISIATSLVVAEGVTDA